MHDAGRQSGVPNPYCHRPSSVLSGREIATMISEFEQKVAAIAKDQFDQFNQLSESDPPLAAQIERYWKELGLPFPGVGTAWSAVFVSWCIRNAGATKKDFKFSPRHAVFVQWAIVNAETNQGRFRGLPITECVPTIGDIIQNNREGNSFGFEHAAAHDDYPSHTAIVVEEGKDPKGRFVITIGGNESDTVGRKRVALSADGLIVQRPNNPYICVVQSQM
ncbi:MAG: DUF2272 domain-containing protein [Acetobacteraceae bacterium]|nr:DUF2272 domain-containing protein [Acetobacteraceae bacterium]